MTHKKIIISIVSVLLAIMLLLISFLILKDEIVSSEVTDRSIDGAYVVELMHNLKSEKTITTGFVITKSPIADTSDYNIVLTFNTPDNDGYRITNLEISVTPKTGALLSRIYCHGAATPDTAYEVSNETYTVKAESDYLYLEIIASDYDRDSIEIEVKYDVIGRGVYLINKFSGLGTSVVI